MSVSSTGWEKGDGLAVRVEQVDEGVMMSMLTSWWSRSRLCWGWLKCFFTSWMLSRGVSGVRILGKVRLAPDWVGLPKGLFVEGERGTDVLSGACPRGDFEEPGGPWAISYAEEEDEDDEDE